MNKKNIINLLLVSAVTIGFSAEAIQFTFKGGASKSIDIALFKNRKNFETFIEHVGGSAESAKAVEQFTVSNSLLIGSATALVLAGVVIAASGGTLAGPAVAQVVGGSAALGSLVAQAAPLVGKLAGTGASIIKSVATKFASHYFENIDLNINSTICRGIVGQKLVRRRDFPSMKPDYMDFTQPQPMFLVIFNREKVIDRDRTVIAEPNEIIFAGEIKPEHLSSALSIRTQIIPIYEVDKENKPILDETGQPNLLEKVIAVKLDVTSKDNGLICADKNLSQASKVAVYTQWAAGLNHILKGYIADEKITLDYKKQLALRVVEQFNKAVGFLQESNGTYQLANDKNVSVKTVQDAVANINTLITQASSNNQLNEVVTAVNNLLKDFEYYIKLKL